MISKANNLNRRYHAHFNIRFFGKRIYESAKKGARCYGGEDIEIK
jgi:hypothetical protein